jgi:hypothetical protein
MKVKDLRRHLAKLDGDLVVLVHYEEYVEQSEIVNPHTVDHYKPVNGFVVQHVEKKMVDGEVVIEPTYEKFESNAVCLYLKEEVTL